MGEKLCKGCNCKYNKNIQEGINNNDYFYDELKQGPLNNINIENNIDLFINNKILFQSSKQTDFSQNKVFLPTGQERIETFIKNNKKNKKLIKENIKDNDYIITTINNEDNIINFEENNENEITINLFPNKEYTFIGQKYNNEKTGFCLQIYNKQANSIFIGNFKNNKRNGYCIYKDFLHKYIFKGETKENFVGKYGICDYNESEIIYEGEWKNNKKDGIGVEKYNDESFYIGEFKEGKKCGTGFYQWNDGAKYEGEWNNNNFEGYGFYLFKEKSFYSGSWKNGQMAGFGIYCFPGLKMYFGYWEKDTKIGFGIIYWFQEPKAFVGFWDNNCQNGFGKFISNNNNKFGFWEKGKKKKSYCSLDEFCKNIGDNEKKYLFFFRFDYNELSKYLGKFLE